MDSGSNTIQVNPRHRCWVRNWSSFFHVNPTSKRRNSFHEGTKLNWQYHRELRKGGEGKLVNNLIKLLRSYRPSVLINSLRLIEIQMIFKFRCIYSKMQLLMLSRGLPNKYGNEAHCDDHQSKMQKWLNCVVTANRRFSVKYHQLCDVRRWRLAVQIETCNRFACASLIACSSVFFFVIQITTMTKKPISIQCEIKREAAAQLQNLISLNVNQLFLHSQIPKNGSSSATTTHGKVLPVLVLFGSSIYLCCHSLRIRNGCKQVFRRKDNRIHHPSIRIIEPQP